jgi:tetratricopeptide (TPR) repeat protein
MEPGSLREKGQAAMKRGNVEEAIALYRRTLVADPQDACTHLSLSAALLEKGDARAACPHLAYYVRTYPDRLPIRIHYAELLFRLHKPRDAKAEFEHVIADAQNEDMPPSNYLIQCHTRLMEIAEADGDEYGEHLHRGIGVFYLACARASLPDEQGKLSVEGLLCQAAGELSLAKLERPHEARPCWYLYEVWTRLDQRTPALKNLRVANSAAPFCALTSAELRGLHVASVNLANPADARR